MSVQNVSFLARLEVAEKFVVGWWWWSRPSLGFNFSQAEQYFSSSKIDRFRAFLINLSGQFGLLYDMKTMSQYVTLNLTHVTYKQLS